MKPLPHVVRTAEQHLVRGTWNSCNGEIACIDGEEHVTAALHCEDGGTAGMDRRHMLADTGDSLNMLATNIRIAYVTGR